MNVALRVEASVTELRRLLGLPDVLAFYEVPARALECGLVACIAQDDLEEEEAMRPACPAGDAAGAGCET